MSAEVELFTTSILGNPLTRSKHDRYISVLTAFKIPFVYHDLSADEDAKRRWRSKSNNSPIPGILVHNEWRGTYEEFEQAVELGDLQGFLRIDSTRRTTQPVTLAQAAPPSDKAHNIPVRPSLLATPAAPGQGKRTLEDEDILSFLPQGTTVTDAEVDALFKELEKPLPRSSARTYTPSSTLRKGPLPLPTMPSSATSPPEERAKYDPSSQNLVAEAAKVIGVTVKPRPPAPRMKLNRRPLEEIMAERRARMARTENDRKNDELFATLGLSDKVISVEDADKFLRDGTIPALKKVHEEPASEPPLDLLASDAPTAPSSDVGSQANDTASASGKDATGILGEKDSQAKTDIQSLAPAGNTDDVDTDPSKDDNQDLESLEHQVDPCGEKPEAQEDTQPMLEKAASETPEEAPCAEQDAVLSDVQQEADTSSPPKDKESENLPPSNDTQDVPQEHEAPGSEEAGLPSKCAGDASETKAVASDVLVEPDTSAEPPADCPTEADKSESKNLDCPTQPANTEPDSKASLESSQTAVSPNENDKADHTSPVEQESCEHASPKAETPAKSMDESCTVQTVLSDETSLPVHASEETTTVDPLSATWPENQPGEKETCLDHSLAKDDAPALEEEASGLPTSDGLDESVPDVDRDTRSSHAHEKDRMCSSDESVPPCTGVAGSGVGETDQGSSVPEPSDIAEHEHPVILSDQGPTENDEQLLPLASAQTQESQAPGADQDPDLDEPLEDAPFSNRAEAKDVEPPCSVSELVETKSLVESTQASSGDGQETGSMARQQDEAKKDDAAASSTPLENVADDTVETIPSTDEAPDHDAKNSLPEDQSIPVVGDAVPSHPSTEKTQEQHVQPESEAPDSNQEDFKANVNVTARTEQEDAEAVEPGAMTAPTCCTVDEAPTHMLEQEDLSAPDDETALPPVPKEATQEGEDAKPGALESPTLPSACPKDTPIPPSSPPLALSEGVETSETASSVDPLVSDPPAPETEHSGDTRVVPSTGTQDEMGDKTTVIHSPDSGEDEPDYHDQVSPDPSATAQDADPASSAPCTPTQEEQATASPVSGPCIPAQLDTSIARGVEMDPLDSGSVYSNDESAPSSGEPWSNDTRLSNGTLDSHTLDESNHPSPVTPSEPTQSRPTPSTRRIVTAAHPVEQTPKTLGFTRAVSQPATPAGHRRTLSDILREADEIIQGSK
ncbi:hypothetical protein MNAN1_000850 [Malassezia nana]|uniref:Uncharacterized protein n=1 Tax=Malassezia nana TaxID=180528 RepID=A0AAF0J1G2_9BASI|nr:hypothetical protein MNAN1_000850 [Malassezia nana]